MTDDELEARLRAFYRAEARDEEAPPPALRAGVAGIPGTIAWHDRRFGRGRGLTLLAAAALLLLSGAMAAGSGVFRLPSVVRLDPVPSVPAPRTTSPAPAPSGTSVVPRAPGWTVTGSLLNPRGGQSATLLLDGRVLVAGGSEGNDALASAELYDPATGTWTATGSMAQPRTGQPAVRLLDGRVLVVGIDSHTTRSSPLASAELYDPATGTWAATGRPAASHNLGSATLLRDGRVLLAGGVAPMGVWAELYDPVTGTWTATGSMRWQRYWPKAILLSDGRVLLMGGAEDPVAGPWLASAELYDPTTGTWSDDPWPMTSGSQSTATLLPDGRVFATIAGLDTSNNASLTTAELYDPRIGWTAAGSGSVAQSAQAATLLPDGRVLVVGSTIVNNAVVGPAASLFDPTNGTWVPAGKPATQRDSFTATLLSDGRVLVAGGWSETLPSSTAPAGLASAELFTP